MERLQEAMSRARARRQGAERAGADPSGIADSASEPQRAAGVEGADLASAGEQPTTPASFANASPFEPNERLLRTNRVMAFFGGKSAGPFDMMRTKILKQCTTNNWKRLVVTSPGAQCGKTTMVANLAFSLARQPELRILVIEVDMRRPELASVLGIPQNLAFARYMSGEDADFTPHVVTYGDNLAFGCNTVPAANPSELLHSKRTRERLAEVEAAFGADIVLFDTPPVLPSDDTLAFLDYADAALIVAAAEKTRIDEVDVTETEVASATNVLGVVMNKIRYMSKSDTYENGYY